MIRERHELGPTSMNVNISIYTSPNLKKTIEARNEGVVRTFRVQPFGPDTTLQAENKHESKIQAQKQKKEGLRKHLKVAQINLDGFKNARVKIALPSTSLGRTLRCVRSR